MRIGVYQRLCSIAQKPGVGQALLAAALFGVSTPFAKLLLSTLPPQILAGLLYLGSGIGLGFLLIVRRRLTSQREANLARGDVPFLLGAIVFGGVIAPILLLFGLSQMAAAGASLLLNLEAVFTALVAWFVFGENVNWRIALGMLSIVGGGILLSWSSDLRGPSLVGTLAIAAACLSWEIDNNITQKISGRDPVQIACIKGLSAGTVNLGLAYLGASQVTFGRAILFAIALGFVSYGLSLLRINRSSALNSRSACKLSLTK